VVVVVLLDRGEKWQSTCHEEGNGQR
jgi:hypothetical protein